ncbi:polyribonucleotide nucleotidyltransferase, partial [candidate division KSB1 bacterium]
RLDGRGYTDVRPITIELGVLPRTHGSALFTRGETQSLTVVTLGTKEDEQKIEGLEDSHYSNYILHYNFPAFSVGEARFPRGPGRREIGHGKLAWKAMQYVIPNSEDFPYTIRIESDILESNGSSSMATVCAGSLAMMDAGVLIKKQTAGIAMGLIKEGDDFFILSDILGDEDHLGDMDFKLAGSKDGFTAVQMDIKIKGISIEIMKKAIQQAREGVDHILGEMNKVIDEPRTELSQYAPSMIKFMVDIDNIGMVIGPGGKMIRELQEKTDTKIWIEDDGTVSIAGEGHGSAEKAKAMIDKLTEAPEVGKIYEGTVKKITDFGAFVEILPGKDGLLHISQISEERVAKVTDKLKMGQEVKVKVKRIDPQGKVDLTMKHLS